MNVCVPGLAFLLVCVVWDLGRACTLDGITMICQEVPSTFSPGYSSLVMILKDVGEINSTALHSDSLASITRLTISRANVTGMAAGALGSFRKLQNLTLDQNGLARVDAAWFDRPAALKALSLAENHIEVLDGAMLGSFTGLTLLNLAKNRIGAIDAGSFVLQSSLAHLDLSGNRLTRVDPEVLRPLSSTSMRLDGNPWNCACGVEDFADFLKDLRSRSLLEREMEVTCMSPASLLGQPVWNVSSACGTSTTTTTPPPPEMTLQPKPTEMFTLQLKPAGKSITVPTLIGVIVALCVLLCVTCFLAVLYRRKRKRESVKPGPLSEEEKENVDEDNVAKRTKSPADPERKELYDPTRWNSEIAWRTPVTGARAKSANAVLLTSPACTAVKDQLTVEANPESPSQNSENTAEGNGKLGTEAGEVGIRQKENAELTNETIQNCEKDDTDIVRWEDDAKAIPCVSVNIDPVPYLSIGTGDPSKPNLQDPVKGQHDGTAGHQLQMRKVMARVSTWPPTSAQWQARCSATDQQEELSIFAIHTPNRPLRAELTGQAEHFEFGGEMQQVACARDVTSGNTSSQSSGVGAVESSSASEIIPETDRAHVVEDTPVPDLPDLVSAVSESDQSMVPPETNELPASDQSMVPPETNELAREWRQSQSLTATSDTDCLEEIAAVEDDSSKLSHEDVNPRSPGFLSAEVQSEGPGESRSSLNEDEEEHEGSAAEVTLEEGAAEMTEGFENHATCESDQGVLVNEQSYEQEQVQQMGPGSSSRQSADQGSFSSTAPSGGVSPPGVDSQYACMDLLHEVVHNHGRWTRHRWKQTHLNQQHYKHQTGPNPGLWWP